MSKDKFPYDESIQAQFWMPSGKILEIPSQYLQISVSEFSSDPYTLATLLADRYGVKVTVTRTSIVTVVPSEPIA